MRICVISSIFPPYSRGGAEMAAYAAARGFAEAGHEVFVITTAPFSGRENFAGKWNEWRTENLSAQAGGEWRMRIFRFTPLNLFTIFSIAQRPVLLRLFWHLIDMVNPHTYLVVRRILLKEKPDLILTHNLKGLGYTVHLAIHHSRYNKHFVRQRAHWFHTLHDMGALHPTGLRVWGREKSIFQQNPLVWLYAWVNKKLLGDPDVVISPSQFLLEEYRARGFFSKSKTVVVRNPVVVHPLPSPSPAGIRGLKQSSNVARDFMSRPGGTQGAALRDTKGLHYRFLYLGQLEPYKGLHILLDVWREFSQTHRRAELIIAGEGSMKKEIEKTVKSLTRVQYVSFVKNENLGELFLGKCILVLPSLAYENSPTSIGESFMFGVPVVASKIGGIPELVKDGINGLLFEPGKVEILRQAMSEALEKWTILHRGAQASAEQFNIEKYREEIEYLISNSQFPTKSKISN